MSTEWRRIRALMQLAQGSPALAASGYAASVGLAELDDCAVVPLPGELELVFGTDFIRGEEFYLFQAGLLSFEDLGYYLVGANASDLAAMGASPVGITVVLRYSSRMTDKDYSDTMTGVLRACADLCVPLLGGDSGGYPISVLSAAAIGVAAKGTSLLRSGGRAGDYLFASGDFGCAGAALAYFTKLAPEKRNLPRDEEEALLESWRRVQPALRQGQILSKNHLSRCAIDTSDGLKVSCEQIAQASGVDVVIEQEQVPISALARKVAHLWGRDELELAFGDSVDFRLLFSVSEDRLSAFRECFQEAALPFYEIGRLVPAVSAPRAYLRSGTRLRSLPGVGWIQ